MARRILAAALAGVAIVMVVADQIAGDSATTSTAETSTGVTTTGPDGDPFVTDSIRTPHPDPLRLYPRRPGARFEDIEARAGHAVQLGFDKLQLSGWSRASHAALPRGAEPARVARYRPFGLVDRYVATITETDGDLLRLTIDHRGWPLDSSLRCITTRAADGAVAVAYDVPRSAPARTTTTTTTTTSGPAEAGLPRVTATLFIPLDTYRGRLYVTCTHALFNEFRAVWAVDV